MLRFVERNLISGILVLFVLLDICNFFISRNYELVIINSVSIYGKALVEILILLFLIYKQKYKQIVCCVLVFVSLPFLWYFENFFTSANSSYNLVRILKDVNKYVFPIILYLFIDSYKKQDLKSVLKVFEYIYIIMAAIVIVAFFLKIPLLHTYGLSRFGFTPPLAGRNEITFFWVIGIIYFYLRSRITLNYKYYGILGLIIFAGLLLGTKAFLLFLFCWMMYLVLFNFQIKQLVFLSIIALCIIGLVAFSGIVEYITDLIKTRGLLTTLTSMRNVLFFRDFLPIIDGWEWWNYLYGGRFMEKFPIVEMDIFDLFLMVGIIGVVCYLYIIFKTIFKFHSNNKLACFFVTQFFLIGSIAGHVFMSGINAIFIAILCVYLKETETSNNCQNL